MTKQVVILCSVDGIPLLVGQLGLKVYNVRDVRCHKQKDVMKKLFTLGGHMECERFVDYIRELGIRPLKVMGLYYTEADVNAYLEKYND